MARLSESLNTVFDILNQLIQAINVTLFDTGNPEATIRHVIGMRMAGGDAGKSLEEYLGQIKTAFLTTQEAYKAAAQTTVERLLAELDPEAMAADDKGGFKFGRLRKGDHFDRYADTYAKCRRWFQSPRFMEDLMREFEKNCHRFAQQQRR
jgi:succinate dehydrogenase/fumarate reductase flavoprotein subunit